VSTSRARKLAVPPATSGARIEGPLAGRIVSVRGAEVRVDFEGNDRGPLAARVSAALDDAALGAAASEGHEVLLAFERGDPGRPVVLAVLRSRSPLTDAVLARAVPAAAPRNARVDGRLVEIEGKEEVILRCGRASLTLTRDGTVILRGVKVVSRSDGVNRIRGAKVEIN
jgi:hypothetical protein